MRSEIPHYTRCCIFFPLRLSLMIWTSIRLLLSIGLVVSMGIRWNRLSDYVRQYLPFDTLDNHEEWLCFVIVVASVEILLGLVYIVGCFMKNVKLMKGYYYHCIVIMVLILILSIYDTVWYIRLYSHITYPLVDAAITVSQMVISGISYGALQLYGILLMRSEIKKLATGYDFKNRTTITEETLDIEQPNEEKDMEETTDVEEVINMIPE